MASTPIFSATPQISWAKVTAADTSTDGTDADVQLIFTAGASGSFLNKIVLVPISTSGSTTTSAAAIRIYVNNGSSVGTAANNVLRYEQSVAAVSVNTAATTAAAEIVIPFNEQVKASYRYYIGVTAVAANTQWNAVAYFGDY